MLYQKNLSRNQLAVTGGPEQAHMYNAKFLNGEIKCLPLLRA